MDRVTLRLWRGVEEPLPSVAEGTSALLNLPMLLGTFRPPTPDKVFPWGRERCKRLLYFEGYAVFAQPSPGKQRKGWRRAKKLYLIGTTNPKFKDLARTSGWKMTTVHKNDVPGLSSAYRGGPRCRASVVEKLRAAWVN